MIASLTLAAPAAAFSGCHLRADVVQRATLMLAQEDGTLEREGDLDKRKQVAKARRAVASEGKGGLRMRKGAKRSEQKAASSGKGFGKFMPGLNFDRRLSITETWWRVAQRSAG